jgi:hypothetical protein
MDVTAICCSKIRQARAISGKSRLEGKCVDMVTTASIASLHQEYQLWIRELTFSREEIRTFETRLELVMQRNSRPGVLASVEHFQNQFIRHKEVIDQLRYELVHSERQLALICFFAF